MENIRNSSDIELTEDQKPALCLGQGFVVSKAFNLGNFLLDRNKFKSKIRWRLFFCYEDGSSRIHPYRKSSGRPAPVGLIFNLNLWKLCFYPVQRSFLSKEFKMRTAKFKEA